MPTIADLRTKFGPATDAFTDQELYELASKAYGPLYSSEKALQKELGYNPNSSNVSRGFGIGLRGAGAGFVDFGALLADTAGATDTRDSLLKKGQELKQSAFRMGRRSDDIDNFTDDPLAYIAGGIGQAAGFAVPSIVGGGAPALGLKLAGQTAGRQLAGAAAGSFALSNLPQEAGGVYGELAEQGKYEPGRAMLFGAGAAGLDTLTEAIPFLKAPGTGGLLRRMATGAAYQAPIEAGTETLQSVIERQGAYKPLGGAEAWHEYRNAAGLGLLGGGAFGALGGIRGVSDVDPTDLTKSQTPTPAPAASVAPPATGLPLLGWNGQLNTARDGVVNLTPMPVTPYGAATPADVENMRATGLSPVTYNAALAAENSGVQPGTGLSPDVINSLVGVTTNDKKAQAARQADILAALSEDTGQLVGPGELNWNERGVDAQELSERGIDPDPARLAIIEAEKRAAARRTAAESALVDREPDGSMPIRVNPREINTHAALTQAHEAGTLPTAQYTDLIGRMREALKNGDNRTLNAIAKQAAQPVTPQTPGAATNAQPDVPAPATVAPPALGSTGNQPAGSGRAVGFVRRVRAEPSGPTQTPNAGNAPASPVAVEPGAGSAPALATPPVTTAPPAPAPKQAPLTQESGDGIEFRRSFTERLRTLRETAPDDADMLMRWLGLEERADGELDVAGAGESYTEIGASAVDSRTNKVGISKEAVSKRIKKALAAMGAPESISPKQLYSLLGLQLSGTDLDTVERNSRQTTSDDAAYEGPAADTTADETAPLTGDFVADDAAVTATEPELDAPAPETTTKDTDTGSTQEDIDTGLATADDVVEAELLYTYTRSAGDAPWARLDPVLRSALVRTYASYRAANHPDIAVARQIRKDHEEHQARQAKQRESAAGSTGQTDSQTAPAASEPASGESAAPVRPSTPTVVTVKKRRVINKAPNTALRIPNDDEMTSVDRDEMLATQEGKRGAGWLEQLGVRHVLNWVSDWALIDNNPELVNGVQVGEPNSSAYTIALKDMDSDAGGAGVMMHELGHAVDLASHGGVYSAHPALAFDGHSAKGAVALEAEAVNSGDSPLAGMFDYPFEHITHDVAPSEMASELFAQLFMMFAHPKGRPHMQVHMPAAYQFMQEVFNDIRQTRAPANFTAAVEPQRQKFASRVSANPALRASGGTTGAATGQTSRTNRSPTNNSSRKLDSLSGTEQRRQFRFEEAVRNTLGVKAADAWTDLKDFFVKRGLPYGLTNFQIFEQYKNRIRGLDQYNKIADYMRVDAQVLQREYDAVAERWRNLGAKSIRALNYVAQRATITEIHPDLAWDDKGNAHVDRSRRADYIALRDAYNALSPEARQVYHDALRVMTAAHDNMEQALETMFQSYGKTMPRVTRLPGPYFPLMRFGDYLAIGESQAYKDAVAAAEGLEGDAKKAADEAIREMQKDRAHYVVSAHETRSAMERAVDEYAAEGLVGRTSMADQRINALPTRNIHTTIASLTEAASRGLDSAASDKIRKAISEIVMRSLPEMHALQRQAERVGVEGADPDMLRAFATQGRSVAFYTARLRHAKAQSDVLADIKKQVYGKAPNTTASTDLQHVYRELEQRAALNLTFHDTPLQDKLATAGYIWFLGSSPTYLLMQGMQTYLVSAPILAGKYGAAATTKALRLASAHAFKVLKDARFKDGKLDLWSGISENSIPGKSVNEDRKAIRELINRGIVDEGMVFNLGMIAESGSTGSMSKAVRGIGWAAQQVEMFNRVATALAAFRLARTKLETDKTKSAEEKYNEAIEAAYADVVSTHMDYSQEGTARFMREGGGVPLAKLFFQFRRYQQAMLYLLANNITKAIRNPKERKIALATLAYLSIGTGLSAGVMGIPFMGTAIFLADLFMDDDDEEGDAQTRLRNALYDMTDDKEMATVMAKGLPALFGVDLSARIGLGSVGQMFPRLEMGKTGAETVGNVATAVAGPVLGGMGTQFVDAFLFARNGDMYKATERMLPKTAADVLKGMRYWTEGMTDRKGEEILGPEEFGMWNAVVRMLGASSIDEANYYEGTRALNDMREATNMRKARIGQKYRAALQNDGDLESVEKLIEAYNEDHPSDPILPKDELAWRRLMQRSRGERDEETGLKLGKRDRAYENALRFAQ